jgi:poly(A) polymerase
MTKRGQRETLTPKAAALRVVDRLEKAGHEALFAGGCVRDTVLGREPKDYDIATDATPDEVTGLFRRSAQVGARFGVVVVRMAQLQVEVATFRTDGSYADGRRPESVTFSTPKEDALRRDFTINGMFQRPATGEIIDFVGGQADARAGLVRAIGDPLVRFGEDHLRMLRAVRFATRLGFEIEERTFAAIRDEADSIRTISTERIRMELEQILADPHRARGWRLLRETGLVNLLVGGLSWRASEADAVALRLDALGESVAAETALAVLLIDRSVRDVRALMARFTFSRHSVQRVCWLLESLALLMGTRDLELADVKTLRAHGGLDELVALHRSELTARGLDVSAADAFACRAAAIAEESVAPAPFVTGDDLQAMGMRPGRRMGEVLDALYRGQLNEEILNEAEAFARAREMSN